MRISADGLGAQVVSVGGSLRLVIMGIALCGDRANDLTTGFGCAILICRGVSVMQIMRTFGD